MVIHNENDLPVEMAFIKKPLFEQQSFIFHNDHVQETLNKWEMDNTTENGEHSLMETSEIKVKRKKHKGNKKLDCIAITSSESSAEPSSIQEISPEDLEELKTVYKKCKAVIKKIETKYGHLLDLDDQEPSQKRAKFSTDDHENVCHCSLNKKIVFDDEGKESTVETSPLVHICPQKLSTSQNESTATQIETKPITVEYHEEDIELPDSLVELSRILKDPNIEVKYRNRLVQKATQMKQQFVNEIKFNKYSLIEKMKTNPDELLTFKGTNLSTLSGYS